MKKYEQEKTKELRKQGYSLKIKTTRNLLKK